MKHKVLFIHGRPGPHPLHAKFALSIGAQFEVVDPRFRWNDRSKPGYYRYLSYFFSAWDIKLGRNTIILSQGILFMTVLLKFFNIRKQAKLIYLLDDEGLFFIKSKYYSAVTRYMAKKALAYSDGIICVGKFQSFLCAKILDVKEPPKVVTFNGISMDRLKTLNKVNPKIHNRNIAFIGNGPGGWRTWYKGLDLMIFAFEKIHQVFHDATFSVIGNWDEGEITKLKSKVNIKCQEKIRFLGKQDDLASVLQPMSLYLHVSRGEAWGISITEAMAAGLPALVSENTGAKEVVEKVSDELIIHAEVDHIVKAVKWYFGLEDSGRENLSKLSRNAVQDYSEERAIEDFRNKFLSLKID